MTRLSNEVHILADLHRLQQTWWRTAEALSRRGKWMWSPETNFLAPAGGAACTFQVVASIKRIKKTLGWDVTIQFDPSEGEWAIEFGGGVTDGAMHYVELSRSSQWGELVARACDVAEVLAGMWSEGLWSRFENVESIESLTAPIDELVEAAQARLSLGLAKPLEFLPAKEAFDLLRAMDTGWRACCISPFARLVRIKKNEEYFHSGSSGQEIRFEQLYEVPWRDEALRVILHIMPEAEGYSARFDITENPQALPRHISETFRVPTLAVVEGSDLLLRLIKRHFLP